MTPSEEASYQAGRAEHWRQEAEEMEAMLDEVDTILADPRGDAVSKLNRIATAVGFLGDFVRYEVKP